MDDFLKMDVFFVVATASLVIITVLLSVFLFYAIRLVRTADRLGKVVEVEARALKGDIDDMRLAARKEAGQLFSLITTVRKLLTRFIAPKAPRE